MPGIFYPRHVLRIEAVLEDFSGAETTTRRAQRWNVIPRSAKLERNDVHTADRLTITVDFREFPFDPRLVRAASVAYYAGNTRGGELELSRANLRFLGVVDVPETYLSEEAQTVTFECRDYTAVLLGQRAKPTMAVRLDRSLDVILRELLATLPGEWPSVLTPALEAPPDVDIAWPQVIGHGRRDARLPVEPKDTLWSVIRRVVENLGLITFVDLDNVVVSPSRTLGPTGGLTESPRVHVVFGENLSDLRLKRTLHNTGRPVVIAQYNPQTGETTRSEWPRPEDRPRHGRTPRGRADIAIRRTGGATVMDHENEAEEFTVTGARSAEDLAAQAQSIYRDRNQYELEGSFSTHDPVLPQVIDGGEQAPDFDVWGIHTATLLYADIAEHAGLAFDTLRSREGRTRYLTARGYDETVAAALVTSWDQLSRDSMRIPFIVRRATLSLDGESGFRAEVDFMAMFLPQTSGALRPSQASAPSVPNASRTSLVRGR